MGKIVSAKAFANNEVAVLGWTLDGSIPDCLGFEIERIYTDKSQEDRMLPAWVPFKNQSNPDWKAQTTSVWPIQKLFWRDLTLRKRRDQAEQRPSDFTIRYRIRAVVKQKAGLEPVVNIPGKNNIPEKTYEGNILPLSYADKGILTNEVTVTSNYGDVKAVFTNGILSAQWLRNALKEAGEELTAPVVRKHMQTQGDKIREYLTGDVLGTLKELFERAKAEKGKVRLALYELGDDELRDALIANKSRIKVILSNSSKARGGTEWDDGNSKARKKLKDAGVDVTDRMFNNNHIGHNKFAILLGKDNTPKAVMTGSTNWTSTGLCGQSNNAVIIESEDIAGDYLNYWNLLLNDTQEFTTPKPLSKSTSNAQGPDMRTADAEEPETRILSDKTKITAWFSPNTKSKSKKDETPPDLSAVYSLMRKADKAIFFACFMPSRSGKTSVIEEAINIGLKDAKMLVYGSISDVTAMPNYVAPPPKSKDAGDDGDESEEPKKSQPAVFDKGRIHIVRASALTKKDLIANFESELLKTGNAIIHDKIVVIDPFSNNGKVILGSHNLGYKASYENDENFVIVQNNRKLIEAYAVHVLDVYDHYRFRAIQDEMHQKGKEGFEGFLSRDNKWLEYYLSSDHDALAQYIAG